MAIDHQKLKTFLAGAWSASSKPCDSCQLGSAALFCRSHMAFLCLSCDSNIHGNKLSTRHERVWLCEVCEQAPAAVTCKADAASLCVSCDADIHSANPLARRHERVPVEPFFDSNNVKSSAFNFLVVPDENGGDDGKEDAETASWLLPNLNSVNSKEMDCTEMKSVSMLFNEMDEFLDFEYPNTNEAKFQANHTENDCIVPVQNKPVAAAAAQVINPPIENCLDIDFCRSKLSSFGYPAPSLSQNVSSSSHDVGVVPDENCMSEISYPFSSNMNTGVDPNIGGVATTNQAIQLSGLDREARVLRYKEKRKNRKFEKTIRYASRKAYAETRPRIKGRFVKRTDKEEHVGHLYGSTVAAFMADDQCCIVPSY